MNVASSRMRGKTISGLCSQAMEIMEIPFPVQRQTAFSPPCFGIVSHVYSVRSVRRESGLKGSNLAGPKAPAAISIIV
jgi:hypothetical protein